MGLFRDNETNNSNGTLNGYKSQLVGGEPIGYCRQVQDAVEDIALFNFYFIL